MRPRFYAGKDCVYLYRRTARRFASMRPRFYAGKDVDRIFEAISAAEASMRPRFYAGKDAMPRSACRTRPESFNEAPLLCGERPRLTVETTGISWELQ